MYSRLYVSLHHSDCCVKFIVGWFNHHGKKNVKTEVQEAGSALLSTITNVVVRKPVKSSILIAYQREYYDTRIRERFDEQWHIENVTWQEALNSGRTEGLEAPVKVKVRTQVAKAAWDQETQEFRESFIKANNEQHAAVVELFEQRNELPETPEDYAKYVFHILNPLPYADSGPSALEHLPCVVNDLVQGLAKRFGMVASILMCGPIPTKGGAIDVVRYVSPSTVHSIPTLTISNKHAFFFVYTRGIEVLAAIRSRRLSAGRNQTKNLWTSSVQ